MKYLKKARLEEGSDWFWAIARSHLFVNEQLKKRNHYAAVLIESSLIEYSVKFLLLLHAHSVDLDINDKAQVENLEKLSDQMSEESLARNIDRAAVERVVSRRFASSLHKFRKSRNKLIHDAFFFGISVKDARKFISRGNRIMDVLGPEIGELMKKF